MTPLRVLIVEDSEDDALIIARELKRGGFELDFERVQTPAAMKTALESKAWDLIISDYSMPQFGGQAALKLYQQRGLDLPFISVSGAMGEDLAVEMMKAGVHDYVMKNNLTRLVPAVARELRAAAERRERKQVESARAHLASIVESCDDAIIGKALDGTVISWNAAAEALYGYTAAEMSGQSISILVPLHRNYELPEILKKIRQGKRVDRFETVRLRKDGTSMDVAITVSPIRDADGAVIGASAVDRDITQHKREEQERLKLIRDLTDALSHVKTLSGLLPICASCKKIRDDGGYWQQVETYIKERSNADFTHGICPECVQRLYPDIGLKTSSVPPTA
jgi:PAS domain S-box-containing protein